MLGMFVKALLLAPLWAACGGGSGGSSPTNTGQTCNAVNECYPGLDQSKLSGAAVCLDKVTGGYCTHTCVTDTDCCALSGECPDQRAEVCSPFESTDAMYCFLSCEATDLAKAQLTDGDAYCRQFAGAAFGCRSTGGGASNRKICMAG